jgi:IS30 family transposase
LAHSVSLELADHQRLTLATKVDVYLFDPRYPWRRESTPTDCGTGILLSGTDLSLHSLPKLIEIARPLNERSRKTLLCQAPAEKFAERVAAIN